MMSQAIKTQSGFMVSEEDMSQLQMLIKAVQGTGELVLLAGDPALLPEIRTENMASLLLIFAQSGKQILDKARPL